MARPFFLLSIPLALAGCSDPANDVMTAEPRPQDGRAAGERVACALAGAESFAPDCTIDRTTDDQGLTLTIRHPDGGFRRLLVTDDGRGLIAADGAVPAIVTVRTGDEIEVALGSDRYRLPATVRPGAGNKP